MTLSVTFMEENLTQHVKTSHKLLTKLIPHGKLKERKFSNMCAYC